MTTLRRSAFALHLLFAFGAMLSLALGTLHFEAAGGAVGYSTPVAVALMGLLVLRILLLSYRRALDAGASALGALAAVAGTVLLAPFVTLALLGIASAVRADGAAGQAAAPWRIALALPAGAAIGAVVLLLVQAVSKAV